MRFKLPGQFRLRGSVSMLQSIIWSVGRDCGLMVCINELAPKSVHFSESFIESSESVIGLVSLQGILGFKSVLTIWSFEDDKAGLELLHEYVGILAGELDRLGFADVPITSIEPIGFQTRSKLSIADYRKSGL